MNGTGKLVYSAIASLDGYIADHEGRFDWAVPDEEAHAFINDLERPIGTYLYGRRMYETMAGWETMALENASAVRRAMAARAPSASTRATRRAPLQERSRSSALPREDTKLTILVRLDRQDTVRRDRPAEIAA